MYWYLVRLEVFILASAFIYTHFLHVWTVKALVRLSACAAAYWHLAFIDDMVNIQNHMSWPNYKKKQQKKQSSFLY